MGIDYVMGYRDAVSALELETNRIIKSIEKGTREEMVAAIDAFIASVYVLRLLCETLEEEMFEEMEEETDCKDCDFIVMCEELIKYIR